MQSDIGTVGFPNHISVVVKDLDKTMESLSSIWGIESWETFEYSSGDEDKTRIGSPFRIRGAVANLEGLGSVVLELIQPLEGAQPWSEFIETHGEGLHHIGLGVSNWQEMVSKLQEHGGRILSGGTFQGIRWRYIQTKLGGIVYEIFERNK